MDCSKSTAVDNSFTILSNPSKQLISPEQQNSSLQLHTEYHEHKKGKNLIKKPVPPSDM